MLKPMMGGPAFICRAIPISRLSLQILMSAIELVVRSVEKEAGTVIALMCDNHPINRSLYHELVQDIRCPWKGKLPGSDKEAFLLIDPVHLFKCLRKDKRDSLFPAQWSNHWQMD